MFCPYVRNTYMRYTGIYYDENNLEKGSLIYEKYNNEECKENECGAWYNGRCRYKETE